MSKFDYGCELQGRNAICLKTQPGLLAAFGFCCRCLHEARVHFLSGGQGDVPFRGLVSRLEDDLQIRFQRVLEAIMDSFVHVAKTPGETSISGPRPLAQILPGLGVLDNRAHASTLSRCHGRAMTIAAASAPRVEYLAARRLFATGLADVGRHEFYAVADVQRLALFPIVRRAERNDVPIAVARIALLNVRTHCWPLDARCLRAKRGKRLATDFFPVLEPATACAGVLADAVNVAHSHGYFLSCCLAVICD